MGSAASHEGEPDESPQPSLSLMYFDAKGIAQPIRDTFTLAGIAFTDVRLTREEFEAGRADLPFGQLPALEVDDETTVAQSKAILRYASKMAMTYPDLPLDAAIVDQWCELHTEFMQPLLVSMYPQRYGVTELDRPGHRSWIVQTHLPRYFSILEKELEAHAFLGAMAEVSMADLCWCPTLQWLQSGTFDAVGAEQFAEYPQLCDYIARVDDFVSGTDPGMDDAAEGADEKQGVDEEASSVNEV